MASDTLPKEGRAQVALRPGFGLMDWVKLTAAANDIGGVKRLGGLRGYTMKEIREHRTEHDAWTVFMGKVYNITPYLQYHPGGAEILLKSAGRDCTPLFNKYHPWVNIEGLAGKLVIGFLMEEDGSIPALGAKARSSTSKVEGLGGGASSSSTTSRSSRSSISSTTSSGSIRQFAMDPPPQPKKVLDTSSLMGKESDGDGEEGEEGHHAAEEKEEGTKVEGADQRNEISFLV